MSVNIVLLILATIFALLAAISVPSPPRLQWLALGLFFYFLSLLVWQNGRLVWH